MKYLIITGKNKIKEDAQNIIDLLSKMVYVFDYELDDFNLLMYFNEYEDFDFRDVIININQDFYNDYRGYISREIDEIAKGQNKKILEGLNQLPFDDKHLYLDDKEILKYIVSNNLVNDEIRIKVLGKYYNNFEMLNTIKVYLDNNQNTSLAAKKLYVHRNTLISRIERFNEETGLDVRTFVDGYLIYHLI